MILDRPPAGTIPAPSPQQQIDLDHSNPTPLVVDVAIVGGGIVGLALATALKDLGLRIALIEANSIAVGMGRRRAYHITLMSGQILNGLSIWQQILPHITTFQHIVLADETCPAVVDLQPQDLGRPALGYVAEHGVLLQALVEGLKDASNISWLCPAEVKSADYHAEGVEVTVVSHDTPHCVQAKLLVAADGARSPLRQQAGIGTKGWQYWQSCITTVIRPEKSHKNIAREHFWSTGPFATLPLPGNRAQIVLTAPHAEAKALMDISNDAFLAELNRRYDGKLGKLEMESDRLLFPVQLMHSDRYIKPRLALVGDAAHSCHPVGGQGLNMGIQDAAALADIIKIAHQRGEDIGDIRVLKRYEHWRKLENWVILAFTDMLDRTFSNQWVPLVVLRRLGLRVMRSLHPLRFLALRLMTGLSGRQPTLAKR